MSSGGADERDCCRFLENIGELWENISRSI